jgi:hypothetical protein
MCAPIVRLLKHKNTIKMQNGNQVIKGVKAYFHRIILIGGTQNWKQSLGKNKTMIKSISKERHEGFLVFLIKNHITYV